MKKACIFLIVILLFIITSCGIDNKLNNNQLSNESGVDFNSLEITENIPLSYAEFFSMDKYGDMTMITIKDEGRFLIVPEEELVPANIPEDVIVLKQPLNKVYLVSTSVMDLVVKNDSLANIRLSGSKIDDWYINEAKAAMESGEILYAGKYNAPDYELIVSEGCNLAIENTMIYHNPEAKEKLEEVGIPVIVEKSSYESHPLGRLEWIKLYGILFNKYDISKEYFDSQLEIVKNIEANALCSNLPTVAFFSVTTNGSITVRKPNDYIVKMIEMAGGQYALKDYIVEEENSLSTINIQMEDFYMAASNADILIYNSAIEGEITSIDDIISKNSLFADFKAVKNGKLYCTGKNFFQESTGIAEFIVDIYNVVNGTDNDFTYLIKLQ